MRGAEAQDISGAPAGRLHHVYWPVLLKGVHLPPYFQELRHSDGIADPEEAPQIRSPPLCWRHCLPSRSGQRGRGLQLKQLLQQDLLAWRMRRGGVGGRGLYWYPDTVQYWSRRGPHWRGQRCLAEALPSLPSANQRKVTPAGSSPLRWPLHASYDTRLQAPVMGIPSAGVPERGGKGTTLERRPSLAAGCQRVAEDVPGRGALSSPLSLLPVGPTLIMERYNPDVPPPLLGSVWIHGIYHNWGGIKYVSMGDITIEWVQSVWGLDGVAIIDYWWRGEHARRNHWIYKKTLIHN